ncbi:MAG: ATP-binding protein [bacterium]
MQQGKQDYLPAIDNAKKIRMLKKVGLFSFFEESTLRELCENCAERFLDPEEILIQEGSMDNAMYLILSGELLVYKGIRNIAVLGPGAFLGEMSLIESKPRSATIKALTQSLLMEIDECHFNKYLASESKALVEMVKTLSSRIRSDLDLISNDMQKLNIFVHDMNNFLALLDLGLIYLQDVMEESGDPRRQKSWEKIEKACKLFIGCRDGLKDLIAKSLQQAKRGDSVYHKNQERILPLIRETIQELQHHDSLRGKRVTVKSSGRIPAALFNALDIKRVLQNLLINAGYVTREQGTIDIIVKRYQGSIIVSIIDEGCGIPESIRPFLFKYPITTKKDGNGLGLLSCKQIIENNHQGKFWFDSKKDQGTAFHFLIPIKEPPKIGQ